MGDNWTNWIGETRSQQEIYNLACCVPRPDNTVHDFFAWAAEGDIYDWSTPNHLWLDYLDFCMSTGTRAMSPYKLRNLVSAEDCVEKGRGRKRRSGFRPTTYLLNRYRFKDVARVIPMPLAA